MSDNLVYPNAQNKWYNPSDMPEGYSAQLISINGGHFGWSDAMSVRRVLDMDSDEVASFVKNRVLPIIGNRTDIIIIVDLEHPIHPGELKAAPLDYLIEIAEAIALRFQVAREVLEAAGISVTLLFWAGGLSWQDRPYGDDYAEHGILSILKAYGAFDFCDGVAYRIYPPVLYSGKTWRRLEDVVRNSHELHKDIFGQDSFLLPQFSWTTHPDESQVFDTEIDEMIEIGLKVAGRCGIWSPDLWPAITHPPVKTSLQTSVGAGGNS